MITPTKLFEVYEISREKNKRMLLTKNLTPGKTVYGERLFKENSIEYREWNPKKSKLAALILKGATNIFIRKNDVVLYLGSASGTTVSHVSDVVGEDGFIFAVDVAPRVMRDLVFVAEERKNIAPILADANKPDKYTGNVSIADVIYQDIAQRNQLQIFLKNAMLFLRNGGYALLVIKARSIDTTKKPKQIFSQIGQELEKEMTIIDYRILEPYQLGHCMFICKKK